MSGRPAHPSAARRTTPRLLLLLGVTAALLWAVAQRGAFDPAAVDAALAAAVGGLGAWGPVAYVAAFAAGVVLFLPGSLLAMAGGALFGPAWGAVLALAGATIGATAGFLAARHLAGDWTRRRIAGRGGRIERLADAIDAEGWRAVALLRLVPVLPLSLTDWGLGLTRIPLGTYVATSAVFMAPGAIAYAWLGHAGREAAAGDTAAIRWGLLALCLLAAAAIAAHIAARRRAGRV
ncbi:putative membrane protein YdjX (TVP38/TMEM64 family) [Constrictibacter sp. MBR-5]|jgi:uncharacterized membrane protein YdjX (TVP38/TMEM64 family)|uniref:TVP38/TMEM64 family protein n=1 Tax=Constrictibacter sp. MBR-5 TaxID=3156467 RepID=UPI00339874F0